LRVIEPQALVEGHKVRVAKQPGRPSRLRQRTVDQPPSDTLATLWRGDEQPGQPIAIANGGQAHACNDAAGPRHPQCSITCCAHGRAVLAVEVIEQATFRV